MLARIALSRQDCAISPELRFLATIALRCPMTTALDSAPARRAQRVPRVAALISMLLGCTVFVGWALDVQALKTILPGVSSMRSNTAGGFVLLGVALAVSR